MNSSLNALQNCPSCNAPIKSSRFLFKILLLGELCLVLRCNQCSLVYKQLMPTSQGLQYIYSHSYIHFQESDSKFDLASENSNKQKLDRCRHFLNPEIDTEAISVLDVGCGSGGFVKTARRMGYNAQGIDPYLPPQLHSEYLKPLSPQDLAGVSSFNIITLLNVVEHLDQPKVLFSQIYHLLKPGGLLLLTCPYGDSLALQFHRQQWGHLALDEHLLFWTPKSLTYLLRQVGFQGKFSYRIAGLPFPYGRVSITSERSTNENVLDSTDSQSNSPNVPSCSRVSLQSKVWQMARWTQRQEVVANLARSLIHLTHTGDYLEYLIRLN